MSKVHYVSLNGIMNDRQPVPPADPRCISRMLSARLRDALAALGAGREVGFPVKAQLRFLGLMDTDCRITETGRAVLAEIGAG